MKLGLLFLKRTDKQGWFRNIVIVFAIMLATATLLSAMALGNGFNKSFDRGHWYSNLLTAQRRNAKRSLDLKNNDDRTVVKINAFTAFGKVQIREVGIYQLTDKAPILPGLARQPGAKEMFVSQGLMDLIAQNPDLKERFAGYDLKLGVPNDLLSKPNEAMAIYQIPQTILNNQEAMNQSALVNQEQMNTIKKPVESRNQLIINIFMLICGLGVCFPLLILVISATRVGMVQREQRYAALSLIGASKRQINGIILAETLAAAGLAVVLGSGLFVVFKKLILEQLKFNGDVMFAGDLWPSVSVFCGVIGLVLMVAIIVNWWALRKVKTSPLGVVKDQKRLRKPTILGALPLLVAGGIIWKLNQLGPQWFYPANPGEGGNRPELYFLGTFLLLMIGLLTAGAFLTYVVAKILEKLARHASLVMATKRLQMFARPIFSSVSGVVLALFVGSFFLGTIASVEATMMHEYQEAQTNHDLQSRQINTNQLKIYENRLGDAQMYQAMTQHTKLMSLTKRHTRVRMFSEQLIDVSGAARAQERTVFGEIYTCQELTQWTKLRCPADYQPTEQVVINTNNQDHTKQNQLVRLTPELLARGTIQYANIVLEFANRADLERGRKFVQNIMARSIREADQGGFIQSDDDKFDSLGSVRGLIQAIMAGTALTIGMAGFSVAVAMIGSFFERKKSFSNLRLMGVDIAQLYRVVLIESIVPLLLAAVLAVVVGLLTVRYLVSVMSSKFIFAMPKADYFWMVGVSLLVTIGIIVSTLPILKRVTALESNRTE